ncbi:MAG: hypothetical protein U1F36_13735 [Planctomycetota bacterium]
MNMRALSGLIPLALATLCGTALPQNRSSRAESVELDRYRQSPYFLIPARDAAASQSRPQSLLVVLPGGDGGAEFLPFVENTILAAAPRDMVGAMATAARWTDDQEIVWPTERNRVTRMRYTTEDYVNAIVDDVRNREDIDPKRIYLLAWSSAGPVAYDMSLARNTQFAGFYVAMSVFKPEQPALRNAKGRRFVLDQSPEDRTTPYRFASDAKHALGEKGAAVWLRDYAGGHGWNDQPVLRLRDGLRWLMSADPAPADEVTREPVAGRNLLENGGFERGTASWTEIDNSRTLELKVVEEGVEGKQCLHVTKGPKVPMDLIRQDVDLSDLQTVQVSARLKTKAAGSAFLKFYVYGPDGEVLNEDVDVVHLEGDQDWRCVIRDYALPEGAKSGALMLVVVRGGEIWIDDARVTVPK